MSRCIGNDARASSLFLTPRLGSSDEPVSNIVGHDIRLLDKFGIGLDGANNFVITNGTTATTPLTIYGDGSGFLFDPPLPGGGSGVNNPMTQDLDAGGFSILDLSEINGTVAPQTVSFAVPGPQEVEIATLAPPKADQIASGMFVVASLTNGFKQTISLHGGAIYRFTSGQTDGALNIHQNLIESDTPPISDLRIRVDPATGGATLLATVGLPIDFAVHMFQRTQGWELTLGLAAPASGTDTNTLSTLVNKKILTDNAFQAPAMTTQDLQSDVVRTNGIADNGAGSVTFSTPTDHSFQNVLNVNTMDAVTTQTQVLTSTLPQVAMGSNLTFTGGREVHNLNIITQDVGVNLQLSEGLSVQSGVVMNDNAITGLTNLTSGTSPNITISGNLDLQTNDVLSGGSGSFNQLSATTGSIITVNDAVSMGGNKITSLGNPTDPNDAVNKTYADALVSSGVTNPMTANLDGGNFDITNVTDLSADGAVQFSGTTTVTNIMDIQANLDLTNTRVEHIDGSSQVWLSADSATNTMRFTDFLGKLVLPTWAKGTVSGVGTIFRQVTSGVDRLMLRGTQAASGIQISKVVMPSHTQQVACKDCNDFAEGGVIPNGGPTLWDVSNNGQEVNLKCWDVARQLGNPYGSGLTAQVHTPYAGMITGFYIKNAGSTWTYTGGAQISIKIGGLPVFQGTPLTVPFFQMALPENLWIPIGAGTYFPDISLEINTPNAGDSIDNFNANPLEGTFTFVQDITN